MDIKEIKKQFKELSDKMQDGLKNNPEMSLLLNSMTMLVNIILNHIDEASKESKELVRSIRNDVLQFEGEDHIFDDITLLQKVCRPHAVLLLCGKGDGAFYLRNCSNSEKTPVWQGDSIEVYKIGETFLFHAYHPAAMKFNGGAQHFADVIREKMIEFEVFKPLPQSTKDDAATETYILNKIRENFHCDRPNTFEVILKIAVFLRKQESLMPVSMLSRIINNAGCRNNWGGEYSGGRGVYRMLHHFYHRNGLSDEEKDAIAMSFVNEYGWHPWDK